MITGSDVLIARQRLGLSRGKFADLLGPPMTPTKVANIEHGREIRPEELATLAPHVTASTTIDRTDAISPASSTTTPGSSSTTSSSSTSVPVFLLDEDEDVILLESSATRDGGLSTPSQPPTATAPTALPSARSPGVVAPSPVASQVQPGPAHFPPGPGEAAATLVPAASKAASITQGVHDAVGVAALYQHGRRRVSNSELQAFKRCRRQWWLGWYRGLRLKLERHTGALAIGDRVHRALAAYYTPPGVLSVDPREALESEISHDELCVLGSVADREATDAAEVMVAFKQDADLARAMVEGYVQWLAETGADQGYQVIAPEQVLALSIPMSGDYPDIMLAGRLDLRVRREHDGAVLFLDHKTTASFEKLTRLLVWDEQMKHYHVLERGNRRPEDPPVAGALYNMLRKVKRTRTARPPFFERLEVHHSEHELDRFMDRLIGEFEVMNLAERRLEHGADHQRVAYPTPGDHCLWGCDYAAICTMFDDDSRVEDFIAEHYVQVNPLDRYEHEKVEP